MRKSTQAPATHVARRGWGLVFIISVLFFSTACLGAEETVTNFAELEVAIHDNESTPIHLNGATFTMTEDLVIDHDCTIDITYAGNVTIDGDATYGVTITNNTTTIGNSAGDYTLTFTNSDAAGVRVFAETAAITATFHYCKFNSNTVASKNGLNCVDGKGFNLIVTCNNCEANSNGLDGFSLKSHADETAGIGHLILNNCNGKNNGISSSVSNGATAHKSWHVVTINGGEYSGNGGPGLAFSGGSTCIVYDAVIHTNGQHVSSVYQVYFVTDAKLLMDGCTITALAELNAYGIYYDSLAGLIVRNTEFINNSTSKRCVALGAGTTFAVFDHCIFRGQTKASTWALGAQGQTTLLSVRNCVFYNNTRHISPYSRSFECTNNIFHTSEIGIMPEENDYPYSRGLTGYNCWYNNTQNFSQSWDSLVSTDIEAAPQFVDAANGDFRLKPTSPCLNAGKQSAEGGYMNIGAWQRKSFLRYK